MSNNNRDRDQNPGQPEPPSVPLPVIDPMRTPVALTEPEPPVVTAMGPIEPEAGRSHVPINYSANTGGRAGLFAMVVVLALAVILVYGLWSRRHAEASLVARLGEQARQSVPVDVVRVRRASGETSLTLPGEAKAFYETTIFARTSGYVDKWLVDIGDRVKQGQVLATIETPELDAQLTASRAKLEALKSEVHVAETTANFAKVSYDRWEAAAPGGAVSQQERDQKKSEMEESNAKLEASKAQVALGEADVQRLTTMTGLQAGRRPLRRDHHPPARGHRRLGDGRQHDQHLAAVHDRAVGPDPGIRGRAGGGRAGRQGGHDRRGRGARVARAQVHRQGGPNRLVGGPGLADAEGGSARAQPRAWNWPPARSCG